MALSDYKSMHMYSHTCEGRVTLYLSVLAVTALPRVSHCLCHLWLSAPNRHSNTITEGGSLVDLYPYTGREALCPHLCVFVYTRVFVCVYMIQYIQYIQYIHCIIIGVSTTLLSDYYV